MENKFIDLLRSLTPEEWNKKVDDNWTIKDVVAHMVGWEKEFVKQLPIIWKTKKKPWFAESSMGDDEFNGKMVIKYKNLSPKQLINEWEKWLLKVQKEVNKIGERNMQANPNLFDWWFDESHEETHYNQIKTILGK